MSSLINKAKDLLNRDKGDNPESQNFGPHSSNTGNKADPRIDSDLDNRNNPTSTHASNTSGGAYTGNTQSGSTNFGPHSSNQANKLDPRVDSDGDNRNDPSSRVGGYGQQENYGVSGANPTSGSAGYGGQQSSNYGPHSSNLANKADPRVDSDLDNRGNPTSRAGGYGGQGYDSGAGYGTTGGAGYGQTGASTTAGPHSSNLANKADPRVDSDLDNRGNPTSRVGGYGSNDPTQYQGGATTGTEPHHGHHHHHGHHQQTAVGGGYDQGIGGTTGGYSQPGATGGNFNESGLGTSIAPHHHATTRGNQSGNQYDSSGVTGSGFDQRGDQYGSSGVAGSGYDQRGAQYGGTGTGAGYEQRGDQFGSSATPGSGNAPDTAGPHNSNLLNKLDPRVDSDLDGSKTYGGNKTHY